MGKNVKRLYQEIVPEHYGLSLKLDSDKLAFSGSVKIKFKKTGRPSKRVTFHQKDLAVTEASLHKIQKGISEEVKLSRINTHKNYDELRLHSDSLIYPGEYEAELKFEAKITAPMHGLYPSYFEHDGQKKVILTTQFESHHAREVFPCIDEPEAKATFQLTLETAAGLSVLSNTPVENQTKTKAGLLTKFEKTPIMSTYLLAMIAGELHCVEAKTKDGVTISTWASLAQPKEFLEFANKEAVAYLEFFSEYFQTPYPLSKCDQVALPDFDSGAMENWGLITYREVALLTDPDNRSLASEQYIAMVIAHELSHQWFGNLVTMKWWDDLWLNESFATLMEYIALDAIHPDWQQWEHFAISEILVSSNRDVYKDVQPVGVNVNHPDEITSLFDPAIVYAKGGRLLKMMREVIGEETFRTGLKHYFAEKAYTNAQRDDLWKSMSKASKLDVSGLMTPWITQSGQAILSVSRKDSEIHLSQERFLLDGEDKATIWPIPLLSDKKIDQTILDKKTGVVKSKEPVLFNVRGSGHYLVDYQDQQTKQQLAKSIAIGAIPAEGRLTRLNDMILLARKGNTSLVDALDVVKNSAEEPRESVWGMMNRVVGLSKSLVEGDQKSEAAIKSLRRELAKPNFARLGWEQKPGDNPNDILLRQTILGILLAGEEKTVIDQALEFYKDAKDIEKLPAELRTIILSTAVRFGEPKEVNRLMEAYSSTTNPEMQHALCAAITDIKDPALGQIIINKAIADGGFVRPQDIFRWFAYLMRNYHTRELTWNWLTHDWNRLEKLFGGSKMMDYMPTYAAGPITTSEWQQKYTDFFTPLLSNVGLQRNIKIGLAEIEARVAWRNREEPKLKDYFNKTPIN